MGGGGGAGLLYVRAGVGTGTGAGAGVAAGPGARGWPGAVVGEGGQGRGHLQPPQPPFLGFEQRREAISKALDTFPNSSDVPEFQNVELFNDKGRLHSAVIVEHRSGRTSVMRRCFVRSHRRCWGPWSGGEGLWGVAGLSATRPPCPAALGTLHRGPVFVGRFLEL